MLQASRGAENQRNRRNHKEVMPKQKWKGGETAEIAAPDRLAPSRRMVRHTGSSGENGAGQSGDHDLAKNTKMKSEILQILQFLGKIG